MRLNFSFITIAFFLKPSDLVRALASIIQQDITVLLTNSLSHIPRKKPVVVMNARRTLHLCLGMLSGLVLTTLCREQIRKCVPVQFTATVATQPFPKSMVSNRRVTLIRQVYSIDMTKAMEMRRRQKVLCYINTYPKNLLVRAVHVRHTWARKCRKYFLMTSTHGNVTNTVALNLTQGEGRQHLWSKIQAIMRYLNRLSDQYDYFYKTDDDSYAVMENLWSTISNYDPNERLFMGYPFYHLVRDGHLSGGAGYLLSRAAFKAIVDEALGKHPACPTYDEDKEDVKVSEFTSYFLIFPHNYHTMCAN
ncbi:glycoprotein-N-acetylgalactosamine 3-beta-galactosyltransferase [Paragonimus westermani]|uniref:N-acetylgalactosaminide beta-1,3-galactosyltransferase n=1 Tax=Paragonimus westermani TaxID=34504 RepID=A0A5J4NWE7_9TREM|nr:glycoprotein-N-acetylgalactosamine 3-beta-galactosyltransferase [Paragonimus westermani]